MLSDAKAAEAYRLKQAQKMLDLFEVAHGRPATTIEELVRWAGTVEGKAVLADRRNQDGKISV